MNCIKIYILHKNWFISGCKKNCGLEASENILIFYYYYYNEDAKTKAIRKMVYKN